MSILSRFLGWFCSSDDKSIVDKDQTIDDKPASERYSGSDYKSYGKRYVNKYYGLRGCDIELTDMQGITITFLGGRTITTINCGSVDDNGFISISEEEYIRLGGKI